MSIGGSVKPYPTSFDSSLKGAFPSLLLPTHLPALRAFLVRPLHCTTATQRALCPPPRSDMMFNARWNDLMPESMLEQMLVPIDKFWMPPEVRRGAGAAEWARNALVAECRIARGVWCHLITVCV